MVRYPALIEVKQVENCRQNAFPSLLYLDDLYSQVAHQFFRHFHDAFLEVPKRIVYDLMRDASSLRVNTYAA